MPAKVVDASVLAAWAFREARAPEALLLMQGADLYAPPLLAYEITSVARKKATSYPDQLEALREALRTALALPIQWREVGHLAVLEFSLATGLTTYDASYLYLTRTLGVPLVTFDEQLQRAAQEMGG